MSSNDSIEGIKDSRLGEVYASSVATSVVAEAGDDAMVDVLEDTVSIENCLEMMLDNRFLDDVSRLLITEAEVSLMVARRRCGC